MKKSFILLSGITIATVKVGAFAPPSTTRRPTLSSLLQSQQQQHHHVTILSARSANNNDGIGIEEQVEVEQWTSLGDDGGVKMRVISSPTESSSSSSSYEEEPLDFTGKDVTVEYIGTIVPRSWSVDDIKQCWLPDQGLSSLAPELFDAFDLNYTKLTNAKKFTKKFIREGLGVTKEAKVDNLLQSVEELAKYEKRTYDPSLGTVFDKNRFTFRLGKGMSIKAFDLCVGEMRGVGESVSVVARCDYAYGKRGLRVGGKVLVPPYATVQYDVTLVDIQ